MSRKDGGESERPRYHREKGLCFASSRERVFVGGTHSLAHFDLTLIFVFLAFQKNKKRRGL